MKYDFETLPDRSLTGAVKWDDLPKGIVPFSVADMEFKQQPELVAGLKEYLDQPIFGYTSATKAYTDAVTGWMKRRHHFDVQPEWLIESPGVVPALHKLVCDLTAPGESVVILTPVYGPFYSCVRENGRMLEECPLLENDGCYDIDFAALEAALKKPEVTMMIFCSPHNPISRVWTAEEVERICSLCLANDVILVADEIHFDLIMPGVTHTSVGQMKTEYVQNSIICTAPSKTFNLAGFQVSNLIVANPAFRAKLIKDGHYPMLNTMAYKACELAYNKLEDWLDELILVVDENRRLVEDFMQTHFPQVKITPMQGTYLLWIDFRNLGLSVEELEVFMTKEAYFFGDEGYIFGKAGEGFERWNLACPTWVLKEALERILNAWKSRG